MPDVGDQVSAVLLVSPFDATTRASLRVTAPDGTSSAPVATTTDGGNSWSAPVAYDQAGVYVFGWTVTGMGASVEYERVGVGPGPLDPDPGHQRTYATSTDLACYLRAAPPLDADRKLREASRALDDTLMTAVYYTDEIGFPADPTQREAVRQAACMIVEWWMETGDELGANSDWQSASAGGVSVTRGATTGGATQVRANQLPPKAWGELTRARLLPGVIYQR